LAVCLAEEGAELEEEEVGENPVDGNRDHHQDGVHHRTMAGSHQVIQVSNLL